MFMHSQASLSPHWCFNMPAPQRCLCWLFNLRLFSVGKNSDEEDPSCLMYRARAVPTHAVCLSPLLQLNCSYQLLRLKANTVLEMRPGRTETSNKADCCVHDRHPGGKGDAAMLGCGSHRWFTCFKTMLAKG